MALWQTFPEFSVERIPVEQEMPEPAIEPMEVAFRRGGQLNNLINTIRNCNYVLVDAAPGAGKTSVLPLELAKVTGALVVLVLPYEPLAYVTYLYLMRKHRSDVLSINYVSDVYDQFPSSGLVVTHAGWLAAYWCHTGYAHLPECYLLQDECHESGAASAFVREFAPYLSTVKSYVMMSATVGPNNFRSMETGGNVVERALDGDYYDTMRSLSSGTFEWAPSRMEGHVVIFEDDMDRVRGVRLAYAKLGVKVMHWHAHIDPYEFATQYALLFKQDQSPVVVVADSTFRSGYTLPVRVIVDSGIISRKVVVDGRESRMTRQIYNCEKQQTRARGGRIDGQLTTYHSAPARLESKMTTLEQVDVEALALLCKLIGRSSRTDTSAATMSGTLVPKEVWSALMADDPLAIIPSRDMLDVASYNAERERLSKLTKPDGTDSGSGTDSTLVSDVPVGDVSFNDLLCRHDMMAAHDDYDYGRYLACDIDLFRCPEVVRRTDVAAVVRHVSRAVEGGAYCSEANYDEAAALVTVVDEYNSKIVTITALRLVAQRIHRNGMASKDSVSLRQYLTRMSQESIDVTNDSKSLFRVISSNYFRKFRIRQDDGDYSAREEAIAQRYYDLFESIKAKSIYSLETAIRTAAAAIDEISFVDSSPRKRFLSISN